MSTVPKHLGIIVDGNRRWARHRGLSDFQGHLQGLREALPRVLTTAFEAGVKEVSVWVFSTENWKRDQKEVTWIMNLIPNGVDIVLKVAHRFEAKIQHIGRQDRIDQRFKKTVKKAEKETAHYTDRRVNICLDHGGQDEIVRAVQELIREGVEADAVTPELLESKLDSGSGLPLDLIIRTGGDMRLSGFLLWQSAYSELHFEDCYFPDLTPERLQEIIVSFGKRERRFGGNQETKDKRQKT